MGQVYHATDTTLTGRWPLRFHGPKRSHGFSHHHPAHEDGGADGSVGGMASNWYRLSAARMSPSVGSCHDES